VLQKGGQPVDEKFRDRRQTHYAENPGPGLQPHGHAGERARRSADAARQCAQACADRAARQYRASDDHRHLADSLNQFVENVGYIDVRESLPQQLAGFEFGAIKSSSDVIDTAQGKFNRASRFIQVSSKLTEASALNLKS
jgi:hypothetical protein